ncbi:hypothetical protein GOP47_0008701 [Adiantum capillus-veneris]|uniref:CRAL-TRIO domain-containing protein n=1 Tax=Adiantum capillus-veneris TaxID=13818 RepID=A0A9D4UYV5_ADICA|nr:hypothetical protein GOP47_0008701 [Adiantum capillus-veneris]
MCIVHGDAFNDVWVREAQGELRRAQAEEVVSNRDPIVCSGLTADLVEVTSLIESDPSQVVERAQNVGNVPFDATNGKLYLLGLSKKMRCPLLLLIACHHIFNKMDFEEFKRFTVYSLDKAVASAPAACTESLPRARLMMLYFVNAPSILVALWKMAAPFVDKVTRDKISFLNDIKTSLVLVEEFGADFIDPKAYGGDAEMILIQEPDVPKTQWAYHGIS